MSLVYTAFVPHPPVIVPEIGRGKERVCAQTLAAYQEISARLVEAEIASVLVVSPHAPLLKRGVTLLDNGQVAGDFTQFGAPGVRVSFPANPGLLAQLAQRLPAALLRPGLADHGALVPLYFLQRVGWQGTVVLMGMPLDQPEKYGKVVGEVLREASERCAIIASGDLSHRLKDDGPYGFDPAGPLFDEAIIEGLKRNPGTIAGIPREITEAAGECGLRSLRLALAAQEGFPRVLSYEGPFGVGYLVAELYVSSPLAHWARQCLNAYLTEGTANNLPLPQGPEFQVKRGCFVTLKKDGELRGCIGTTQPWQENLALEIQHNAIAAGTEDPRFWPVEPGELPAIRFSVDVLGDLEKVAGPEELDPWHYGVVVRGRGRTGLLLPHLEGVNTVAEQVTIAKQKAGLRTDESVEMWRFEVVRHYE